ncbi:recombination protein NinG [Comamonas thiooxydans]|uniref:recombination protein NinG n=2 Tax=Comamonas thiooxydans TaxID=363952 RepID=UPI003082D96F
MAMKRFRRRANVLHPVNSLSQDLHSEIKKLALEKSLHWSTSAGDYVNAIVKFRNEVKEHYYVQQRRRCCYCSTELLDHKITFDAEHILDKADYPEYMFDEANIAVACKLCNQKKSNKAISTSGRRFSELSKKSSDYSIVHPHLDEWNEHLDFDQVDRIVALPNSQKGKNTIAICGITALNATRLADAFAIEDYKVAEVTLRTFLEVEDQARKLELLSLLDELAQHGEPDAATVMQALKGDVQATPQLPVVASAVGSALIGPSAP